MFASCGFVLFQESLLYTYIPLRQNVSVRISLRGLRRLIWVDTVRRAHNVGFLEERLIFHWHKSNRTTILCNHFITCLTVLSCSRINRNAKVQLNILTFPRVSSAFISIRLVTFQVTSGSTQSSPSRIHTNYEGAVGQSFQGLIDYTVYMQVNLTAVI